MIGPIAVALLASASGASPATGRAMLDGLRQCHAITEVDRRLACFEAAATRLEQAVDDRAVSLVDREAVRRTRRSLFGFTIPKVALAGLGSSDDATATREEIKEVTGLVQSVQDVGPDRTEVWIDDGSVWRSLEAFRRTPRAGETATIVRGALGAYFMSIGRNHVGTRCIRVR